MGGDSEPKTVNLLAEYIQNAKNLKVGWYSGMDELSDEIKVENFDYIKIGHYDYELGGLDEKTTNQRLYKVNEGEFEDITSKFWK